MASSKKQREAHLRESVAELRLDLPRERVECCVLCPWRSRDFRGMLADFILRHRDACDVDSWLFAVLVPSFSKAADRMLQEYSASHCPDLNWLLLDEDGQGRLCLHGRVDDLQCPPFASRHASRGKPEFPSSSSSASVPANLFTPNHQWLLKVLMLSGSGGGYWAGPDLPSRITISALAEAADLPQSSVSLFAAAAEAHGFLRRDNRGLSLVRVPELLDRWAFYLQNSPDPELAVRSVFPGEALEDVLDRMPAEPGWAVSGHAGAVLLDLGISNVESAVVYASDFAGALDRCDLVEAGKDAPLRLRVPKAESSVFRSAVRRGRRPVADVLQIYLDVRGSAARGREQADHIYEHVLEPLCRGKRWL